jgi:decaprenyl-phosphate phosphoribosyltransferase
LTRGDLRGVGRQRQEKVVERAAMGPTTTDPAIRVADTGDRTSATWMTRARALLALSRPRQWVKNVLVLAAPIAAGRIVEPSTLSRALLALVAFTIVASGVYWINDAIDAATDRLHPTKRHRPIAAGRVSPTTALYGGSALEIGALVLAWVTIGPALAVVLGTYAVLQLAYTAQLKRVPVVELMIVAAGFVIRALAGGVATDIALTEWFLIVTSFGALFVVAGKRYAESIAMGDLAGDHRAVLERYPQAFLQQVVGVCLAVTLLAYCLWAFRTSTLITGPPPSLWVALSVVPVTLIALRYLLLVAAGRTGEPEELLLRDRVTAFGVLAAGVMVLLGLYG